MTLSDAFLVLRVGDVVQKTTVIRDDLNPMWPPDEAFDFDATGHAALWVDVWDKDVVVDDYLGGVCIPLVADLDSGDVTTNLALPLVSRRDAAAAAKSPLPLLPGQAGIHLRIVYSNHTLATWQAPPSVTPVPASVASTASAAVASVAANPGQRMPRGVVVKAARLSVVFSPGVLPGVTAPAAASVAPAPASVAPSSPKGSVAPSVTPSTASCAPSSRGTSPPTRVVRPLGAEVADVVRRGDGDAIEVAHVCYDEGGDGGLNELELEVLLAHIAQVSPPAPGTVPPPEMRAAEWLRKLATQGGAPWVDPTAGATLAGLRALLVEKFEDDGERVVARLLPPPGPDGRRRVRLLRDHYTLHETLGSGKYATVVRGVEKETGREWAVKLLDRARAGAKGVAAAHQEVELLKGLGEARGVVEVREMFETPFRIAIVLELVRGGELFDVICRYKRYSEATAARLASRLFSTMALLHSKGIAHRDIKPENILLANPIPGEDASPDEIEAALANIKVADFGFAKRVDPAAPDTSLTDCCGTPAFIAPEVLEHGYFRRRPMGYGCGCDIWSCGVLVYVLLAGYPPFHSPSRSALFQQICDGRFTFHRGTAWDMVSPFARDFVSACLTTNPSKRLTAAAAMSHPWISGLHSLSTASLPAEVTSGLGKFCARDKFKGVVFGVAAASRMRYLALCQELNCTPHKGVLDALDTAQVSLDEIDLSANYLGPRGMCAVVELATSMPRVASLRLRDNRITDDAVVDIASRITSAHLARFPPGTKYTGPLGAVTALDLSHNPITSTGARALLEMIKAVPSMLSVALAGAVISPFVAARLDRAIGENRALPANSKYLCLRIRPFPALPLLGATAQGEGGDSTPSSVAPMADGASIAPSVAASVMPSAAPTHHEMGPPSHRDGMAATSHRDGVGPPSHRDGMAATSHRDGVGPPSHRDAIASHREGMAATSHRDGVGPPSHRDGMPPTSHRDAPPSHRDGMHRDATAPPSHRDAPTSHRDPHRRHVPIDPATPPPSSTPAPGRGRRPETPPGDDLIAMAAAAEEEDAARRSEVPPIRSRPGPLVPAGGAAGGRAMPPAATASGTKLPHLAPVGGEARAGAATVGKVPGRLPPLG